MKSTKGGTFITIFLLVISEKKMENDWSCEGIADYKPAFAAPVIHVLLRGTPVSISQFQLLFSL